MQHKHGYLSFLAFVDDLNCFWMTVKFFSIGAQAEATQTLLASRLNQLLVLVFLGSQDQMLIMTKL